MSEDSTAASSVSSPPSKQPVRFSNCAVALLVLISIFPLIISPFFEVKNDVEESVDFVNILNSNGKRSIEWKAEEAVKFSLEQVVTAINYVFVAAAAGLALVGKYVVDHPEPTKSVPLSRTVLIQLGLASLLWIGSLVSGILAHFHLIGIGTKQDFSIYGPAGICFLIQLIYFFTALVLVLVATVNTIETRLMENHR